MSNRMIKLSTVCAVGFLSGAISCGGKSSTDNTSGDGDGDGDGMGANTGDGDGDSPRGSGGSGGGGTGGSSTGGSTGQGLVTLGDDCSSPGTFACAGNNQKLALICGAAGTWDSRETCSGDALCDFNPGPNEGTCRVPLAECLDGAVHVCEENEVAKCLEGGFETTLVEECDEGCADGTCVWVDDPCPEVGVACIDEGCAIPSDACWAREDCENHHWSGSVSESTVTGVRLPMTGLCTAEACDREVFIAGITSDQPEQSLRYTVGPGWGMIPFDALALERLCDDTVEQCLILPPTQSEYRGAVLVPLFEDTVIRNLKVEVVEPGTTCD